MENEGNDGKQWICWKAKDMSENEGYDDGWGLSRRIEFIVQNRVYHAKCSLSHRT